jgi:hypothetical protein
VARNGVYERKLEMGQCSAGSRKIRGTYTIEFMPIEDLRRRRSLYAMLFKVYFEEALNTCCTECSGICTVISYKTHQFLLLTKDQIIFSID